MCIKLGDQIRITHTKEVKRSDRIVLGIDEEVYGDAYIVDEALSTNGRAILVPSKNCLYKYIYYSQRDALFETVDVTVSVLTPTNTEDWTGSTEDWTGSM